MGKALRISVRFFWMTVLLAVFVDVAAQNADLVISGTVKDRSTKRNLENVTVSLSGTSIGTVTNADGFFSLKIPGRLASRQVELSHVGYVNNSFAASESTDAVIWMMPAAQQLDEAVVYGGDARMIVEEALKKVPDNYSPSENIMSTFYRETVQKGNRYISVSEAMMDVYKTDYSHRTVSRDKVQLSKARRIVSQKASDTLAVKIQGGPNLAVGFDVAKNAEVLFDRESIYYYSFTQEPSVFIGNRLHYVISFKPLVVLDYALFVGRVYVDSERLSFTRAEFALDLSDHDKAVISVLREKPLGLRMRLNEVSFLVSYRYQDGVTYLNYICNEMRFKCDWRRRLFSSTYTARAEMAVVDNELNPTRVITPKEAFKSQQIFYDVVDSYWHEDYWKDYNIIEPTESLESAVRRLRK